MQYYEINEQTARRANDVNSMSDYRPGSATEEYRAAVDKAAALVQARKAKISPYYRDKLDALLDRYARRLADYYNAYCRNESACPSILVCGGGNFPVRKKQKQNARRDSLWQEYKEIEKYGLTVYDGKAEQEDKTSMNISITKKTSTHNTTAAAGRAIRYIVVHYTAGVTSKPGSAAGTASYFGGTSKQVSADFIVDDGGAVQYNGNIRNRYTWHCGGGKYNTKGGAYYGKATNRNTIGIEVCSTNDTGKMTVANDSHWRFTDKVVSNLVELVKYLMAEYGIDAAHVIRHYDVNGKPCPGIIGWNEDTGSAAKWAAFKARLGAATPGGQTGGSTNTGTATGNTALTYKVGDIVQFAGGKHYANAQAASGTTVKPGPAKVTAVAPAGKHPYHLVHTDGTSTVYGWVDAAAITGKASATPAVKTYTVKAGDSLWRIAAQQLGNGARYKEIKTLNGLKNNTIHAGQVLKLPN